MIFSNPYIEIFLQKKTFREKHKIIDVPFIPPNNKRLRTYVRGKRFKFIFEHRFDTGFCSAGEHKVRPYIGFGNWLDLDYYDLPENL
jgi:hypothetical protein